MISNTLIDILLQEKPWSGEQLQRIAEWLRLKSMALAKERRSLKFCRLSESFEVLVSELALHDLRGDDGSYDNLREIISSYKKSISEIRPFRNTDPKRILVLIESRLRTFIDWRLRDELRRDDSSFHNMKIRVRNAVKSNPHLRVLQCAGLRKLYHVDSRSVHEKINLPWTFEALLDLSLHFYPLATKRSLGEFLERICSEAIHEILRPDLVDEDLIIQVLLHILEIRPLPLEEIIPGGKRKELGRHILDEQFESELNAEWRDQIRKEIGEALRDTWSRVEQLCRKKPLPFSDIETEALRSALEVYLDNLLSRGESPRKQLFIDQMRQRSFSKVTDESYRTRYAFRVDYAFRILLGELRPRLKRFIQRPLV